MYATKKKNIHADLTQAIVTYFSDMIMMTSGCYGKLPQFLGYRHLSNRAYSRQKHGQIGFVNMKHGIWY